MNEKDRLIDELTQLRKKIVELEQNDRLFKEREKKLQAANQQLQASGQQLISRQETLIRTQKIAHVGSWEWDVATDTVTWSDELFKIFKLDPKKGAVSYTNHPKIYTPESMHLLDKAVRHTLETGEPYKIDLEIVRGDGTNAFCLAQGYAKKDDKGEVIRLYGSLQDITERKSAQELLRKIEWLLQPKKEKPEVSVPDYGDLTTINQNRTILDSVGKEVLNEMVSDYLSLLETSAAVYEKNGDYAVGIFSSEWCRFMDCSSRSLCKTKDNSKALESGQWICHESCWADASKQSMQTNKAIDIECSGGLRIYAIPIRANEEVIGSINFGYGDPPTDEDKLTEIATNYNVSVDKLKKIAQKYESRPPFIIDIAKEKLETSAKLIGNIVERKQMEQELLKSQKRYQKAQEIGHVGNWEYDPVSTNFWASDEAKRIYGYDLNTDSFSTEMVENCIIERERVHQALIDLLEHNKTYDLVFDIITFDKGTQKTIHSIAEVDRDAKGNPLKVTGVVSDISAQKKAEDKLKAMNQHLVANEQQLRASNQQLQANEQQLKAANQQLSAANQQLSANEQQLRAVNESLIVSEKQFRNLFNSMQEGVYLHDMVYDNQGNACNYRIIEANPISEKLLNINSKDAIGKLATELYGTKEAPFIDKYIKVTETGDPISFEQYFEPMEKHFLISVFSPSKGSFATAFLDITDRKQAEKNILKNQYYLSKAQEIGNMGTWELDLLQNQLFWTDENYKIFGVPTETPMTYELFLDCIHPDDKDYVNKEWTAALKNKSYDIEHRLIRGKQVRWVREKADIEFDNKGNAIKAIGFTQDITKQKKSEAEIIKAKEKVEEGEKEFRLLAEAMPQIVWVTRADGWNTYFNQQWVDYTGQTLEESSGNGWAKPFHPNDQQRAWLAWQNAITNNEAYSLECQIRKFDGSYRWWLVRGVPVFNQNGKISKWFGTCTDIHEIKHKEIELLNAKQKAEESDRLKSAFLANMSHEIRTPMNGILGFSRLLKEPRLTGLEQQKYIGIIEKSGARMLNIINDIIDISKIEAGLMTVDITESDINEQIEYIYTFFKPEVKAKGMKLSYKNTLPANEAIIKTDREKIFAILTNLVKNAIKYSNKGSIEFGYNKKGDFIEFFVKDTGIGIPKERQSAIFKRFIQSDIEDKMARQGAGLGLAITKAYIDMMGGNIWVESQEEKGSVFFFTIPYNAVYKKEINNDLIAVEEELPKLDLKILIVEDDEISSELLSIIVEKYEKEIISVTNGNDAVEACRKNPDIDLIFMDIRLPGMDGYEVTQRIREFNEKVIIIAQTAYGLSGDREKALNAGCNDYISKPIKKEVFDVLIQTYFKK